MVIAGALTIAFPRHALTFVQLAVVTAGVAAGVYALATGVPRAGWISPFKWLSPFSRSAHRTRLGHRSRVLELIRARISDRRQAVQGAEPMPPSILRRLRALIAATLDLDPRDPAGLRSARARLSPFTYAVLTAEPLDRPSWLRTHRPDPPEVAKAVHRVLDELERLAARATYPQTAADSSYQRTT